MLDLLLIEGTMDRAENGSLKASGFQLLVQVTRQKDDHRFSAVFSYESKGWFFGVFSDCLAGKKETLFVYQIFYG